MSEIGSPEGIERRHIHEAGGAPWQSWPIGVLGLGLLLAASIFGLFGTESRLTAASDGSELTVHAPTRIRNGEFYEMVMTVVSDRAITDLVLRVDTDVWRDVTVNTFIPAPTEETVENGSFAFSFGALEAGERLVIKVDCQVNPDHPVGANAGPITAADGDAPLATVDYRMEVLP